jgi:hypothetical protein
LQRIDDGLLRLDLLLVFGHFFSEGANSRVVNSQLRKHTPHWNMRG